LLLLPVASALLRGIKNTPDMSLPARRAIVNGLLGKNLQLQNKEKFPGFARSRAKNAKHFKEGNTAKTNNSSLRGVLRSGCIV